MSYRRNKGGTPGAMSLERDIGARLVDLEERLLDGSYRPGRSICFVVEHPKLREVWAAEPIDRVVHHLFYNHVGAGLERTWIADTFACIPGRGTLRAVERLEHHIRSQTQNWSRPGWYLKCDIANFFPSIHKPTLAGILDRVIREPWWLDLALRILFHDPRENYELRSSPEQIARVPEHKSLFNQDADHGLAIGNLTSQIFANVQLNPLDQFIKRDLGVRHYVRYVDDLVLLHESPQQLNTWLEEISAFLRNELRLELNTSKTIRQPIDRGVDFVGQVIKPWYRSTRRRTVRSILARLEEMDVEDLYEAANSAFGLLRQATHSHSDRAVLAGRLLRRGLPVDHRLTKAYRAAA